MAGLDLTAANGEDKIVAAESRDQWRAGLPTQFKEAPQLEERADIVLYTQAWDRAGPAETLDDSSALIHCRVILNGREMPMALGADVQLGNDFATITIKLYPTSLQVVALTEEEWKNLRAERL